MRLDVLALIYDNNGYSEWERKPGILRGIEGRGKAYDMGYSDICHSLFIDILFPLFLLQRVINKRKIKESTTRA